MSDWLDDGWIRVTLPNGATFEYEPGSSLEATVANYNREKHEKDPDTYPQMVLGAPAGLRLTLSGASDAMKEATLKKKSPWQDVLFSDTVGQRLNVKARQMAANKQRVYYDEEENVIYTLDEPGFSVGDIADVARPATALAAETAATLIPAARAGTGLKIAAQNALGRAGGVGAAGTVADKGYELMAKFFGGLEDPRSMEEQVADAAGDWLTRSVFEFAGEGISLLGRSGLKKVGRGFSGRDEVAENLAGYRSAFGQDPSTLGVVTGPGSKVQAVENYITTNYPGTAPKLQKAIDGTEQAVRDRIDEVAGTIEMAQKNAPDIIGPVERPSKEEFGKVAITGIEGRKIPYERKVVGGRLRNREGGMIDVFEANKSRMIDYINEYVPGDTMVNVGGLKRLYDEAAAAGAPKEALAPLKQLVGKDMATLDDLRTLMTNIGARGKGQSGLPADIEQKVYASAKSTLHDVLRTFDDAVPAGKMTPLEMQRAYDDYAKAAYSELKTIVRKVTKVAGGEDATPADAAKVLKRYLKDSDKLNSIMSRLEPEEQDFVRRGLLNDLFDVKKAESAFSRWNALTDEVKNVLAPPGTYRRETLDAMASNAAALKLFERTNASASSHTMAQVGLGLNALRKAASKGRGILGGALGAGAVYGFVTGQMPLDQILTLGGVSAAFAGSSMVWEVAKRASLKKGGKLLTSPAYMDWVTSVTRAMPAKGAKWGKREAAMDFLISLTPRIAAERKNISVQEARDMQELQEIYLEVLDEALNPKPPKMRGAGSIPPVTAEQKKPEGGILAQIPQVTARRP